jgi:hypothetical protein
MATLILQSTSVNILKHGKQSRVSLRMKVDTTSEQPRTRSARNHLLETTWLTYYDH